jgi:hypothetical protein
VAVCYPTAMVGGALDGSSNVLPPTLALVGVMWVQAGGVLLFEGPARRALRHRQLEKVVATLGALGMGLYLWHKLAELPAAWLGERLGAPIDAGIPGEPGFWLGRLWWIVLCLVAVAPVMVAVVAFETRRRRDVPATDSTLATVVGGAGLFGGIVAAMALGAQPGAAIGLLGVAAASLLLRRRGSAPGSSASDVASASEAAGPASGGGTISAGTDRRRSRGRSERPTPRSSR